MGVYRYIKLGEAADKALREAEQNPWLNKKVRLRSQILRLSNQGLSIEAIASYVGKNRDSVERTFKAWEAEGFEGLADLPQRGNRRKLRAELLDFMQSKLNEDRSWNAVQLVEAIAQHFDLSVDPETVRRNLRQLGYAWKRDRYVVAGTPNPELFQQAKADLETLKKGPKKVG